MAIDGSRNGFALFEVILALAVGALLLVAARGILESVADGADVILAAAVDADREGNADRLLRALVGQIEAATVVRGSVVGDDRHARLQNLVRCPSRLEGALHSGTRPDSTRFRQGSRRNGAPRRSTRCTHGVRYTARCDTWLIRNTAERGCRAGLRS